MRSLPRRKPASMPVDRSAPASFPRLIGRPHIRSVADRQVASIARAGGRDVLRAIASGQLPPPPAASLLQLELIDVDDGLTTFGFVARPEFGNPDHAHGGLLAAILDFGVATAVWSQQPAGVRVVTTDLHVSFLLPIELDGAEYRCTGRVAHSGRSQVNAVAEIAALDGEVRVMAMATCRVLPTHPSRAVESSSA